MEEGPEPQEWVERAAEEHHHREEGHGAGARRPETMASAVTAAILAVLAAVGSLLSGHAANQAFLSQIQAADKWSYFQAKSTKSHLYEVGGEVVKALSVAEGTDASKRIGPTLARFQAQADRYAREQGEIQHEAEALEAEGRHEFHQHHRYALGIAAFQVGIVLASVSILVRYRPLYLLSLVAGAMGVVVLILGLVG